MADVFEEEAEETVSIQDYLKEVEEQELEADLVLGGDEGKECTYPNGYMKRQAIFSCLTCTPDGNAGVCTACSLSCHDGHELVELWTKRNFRCDCGNSKFGVFFCKLLADKDIENISNSYNHNFKGLYCTCGRPYPDPDVEEQVEMIQCCVCEDWFHDEHTGLTPPEEVPRDEEGLPLYEDFICANCSAVCCFLTLYPPAIQIAVAKPEVTENSVDEKNTTEDTPSTFRFSMKPEKCDGSQIAVAKPEVAENSVGEKNTIEDTPSAFGFSEKPEKCDASQIAVAKPEVTANSAGEKNITEDTPSAFGFSEKPDKCDASHNIEEKDCTLIGGSSEVTFVGEDLLPGVNSSKAVESNQCDSYSSQSGTCLLGVDLAVAAPVIERNRPFFLAKNWRDFLCKCHKCLEYYNQKHISFMIDNEDSIVEYEKLATLKREEIIQQQEGVELDFLNNMGHVQKLEVLSGISDMKNEIHTFLESFDASKAVTTEDIQQVFENLAKKRRRQ